MLTADEYEVMKAHTLIGAQMLSGSASAILQMAEQIARSHHEHWDGSGYPDGLAGTAIPETARIVAVVDAYDAMTHDRVYRAALPEDEVLAVLDQGCGVHFRPGCSVRIFCVAGCDSYAGSGRDGPNNDADRECVRRRPRNWFTFSRFLIRAKQEEIHKGRKSDGVSPVCQVRTALGRD